MVVGQGNATRVGVMVFSINHCLLVADPIQQGVQHVTLDRVRRVPIHDGVQHVALDNVGQ